MNILGRDRDCDKGCGGMDSSMLFFFLILVIIFNGDMFGGGCGCR